MEDYGTIILTSVATLVITVVGALVIEFIKRIKPKIVYSVRESIPIEIEENKIGANVVYLHNPSSRTVKDIVVKVKSSGNELRNGGVKCTAGLDYETAENGDTLQIEIPFLKSQDNISITTIVEGKFFIPKIPDVSVRSPDAFKLISDTENKATKSLFRIPTAAIVAAFAVGVTLSVSNSPFSQSAHSDQGTVMSIAASLVGLPDLAEKYVSNSGIYYYNQGPYVYSLVKFESNVAAMEKYKNFLIKTISLSNGMASSSEAGLSFFIGKIEIKLGNNAEAELWFEKSKKSNESEYAFLDKIFDAEPAD